MPRRVLVTFAATGILLLVVQSAFALILGGAGNEPVPDPGWLKGAAAVFNSTSRVAWWEGPPFGGGEWHAECRGNADQFNAVLQDFAKLDAKTKRLVVHDGTANSFWLSTGKKSENPRIDWDFAIWQPANWKRLNEGDPPPPQIHLYTAEIPWTKVKVPEGIEIVDERLESHGFTAADGIVIEGLVTHIKTKQPLLAKVRLESTERPRPEGPAPFAVETKTDAQGRWTLKKIPPGTYRVVMISDGFVSRVASYERFESGPRWKSIGTALAPAVLIAGRVIDASGQPLPDAQVRLIGPLSSHAYRASSESKPVSTDSQGRFQIDNVPEGEASLVVFKPGYCRPGLPPKFAAPKNDVELTMIESATLRVTVEFPLGNRPDSYIVELEPEGGSKIGSFGGSANINASNQFEFKNVPPGKYIVKGHPNPSTPQQTTDLIHIDLKGTQFKEVILKAR